MLLRTISVTLSLFCSVLLAEHTLNSDQNLRPFWQKFSISKRYLWPVALKNIINECIYVVSEEGEYSVESSTFDGNTCGVYIYADPRQTIEVDFDYFNTPCATGSLVTFVDGWEMNGHFFPSSHDHPLPMEERYKEFCGVGKAKYVLRSSQNAALIQYRLFDIKTGFTFSVRFHDNPTPCNILLQDTEAILSLRNFGKRNNCTVSALFPATVKVIALNVGEPLDTCRSMPINDFVQMGCSNELGDDHEQIVDEFCGQHKTEKYNLHTCGVSTVRLTSSGLYNNFVTLFIKQYANENYSHIESP